MGLGDRHSSTEFDVFVREHGCPVFGTRDFGLNRDDALSALAIAIEIGIPILGGDFYTIERGRMRPTHISWYADRFDCERAIDYANRSWAEAKKAILDFPWSDYSTALVALVRADSPPVSE